MSPGSVGVPSVPLGAPEWPLVAFDAFPPVVYDTLLVLDDTLSPVADVLPPTADVLPPAAGVFLVLSHPCHEGG